MAQVHDEQYSTQRRAQREKCEKVTKIKQVFVSRCYIVNLTTPFDAYKYSSFRTSDLSLDHSDSPETPTDILDAPSLLGFLQKLYLPSSNMPDREVINVVGFCEPSETTESIVLPGHKKMAWLTEPPETAELIVLKAIIANDPRSDDRCAICRVPYGTPNEDGTITEYALRFPCGHDVGNVCMREQDWPEAALLRSGCFLCRKSVVPARYVQEQVKEIWAILKEMSSEDIDHEQISRGPLSRAIEPLRRYVGGGETAPLRRMRGGCEAASLRMYMQGGEGRAASPNHLEKFHKGLAPNIEWLKEYHKDLAPSFEWLLIATWDFLFAVRQYVENSEWINSQRMSLEAIKRRKREVERSYGNFQIVVRDTAHLIHESYST